MNRLSLFADHELACRTDQITVQDTIHEFTELMQGGESNLAPMGNKILEIVRLSLPRTNDELQPYLAKGRGADFTALHLYIDHGKNDTLSLHLYPRDTRDLEYHRHGRRVLSTVTKGSIVNYMAHAEFLDSKVGELDVWDLPVVDEVFVPTLNNNESANLHLDGSEEILPDSTYEVPTDKYHRVVVEAGTLTLCWFAQTGMITEAGIGRVVKPHDVVIDPVRALDIADLHDMRSALME